jgi:hypothetical protein
VRRTVAGCVGVRLYREAETWTRGAAMASPCNHDMEECQLPLLHVLVLLVVLVLVQVATSTSHWRVRGAPSTCCCSGRHLPAAANVSTSSSSTV